MIITVLMVIPGTGFANKIIQTTQHTIVIDPGHGGKETGLVTSSGLEEKAISLKLALKTAQRLESRFNVILTRTDDTYISIHQRMLVANKSAADFFLSIHLHKSNTPYCYVYYFDPPKPDKPSTPAMENTWKSQPLLHQPASKQAAGSFSTVFCAHQKTNYFFSKGAPIIVLEGSTMPALLLEPLSISTLPQHPDETETILDEYAGLIADSIDLYFKKK